MSSPRFAIYFVPASDSPLAAFGASVLGYDAEGGAEVERAALPGIETGEAARLTTEPARYGFHATLKAPFRLQSSRSFEELRAAADALASCLPPVELGPMSVQPIGAFLALRPTQAPPTLDELAAGCVRAFDEFRAPLSAQERERRLKSGLSARQIELLDRWGYPYVLDEYRFHMTLAGPVPSARREAWRTALTDTYGELAGEPVVIDSIVIVRQDDPASRFRVVHRARLGS